MGFCQIADMEKLLQISIPAAKTDAAQRAIDEATAAIKNYCRQVLELVVDDEITLDSIGARQLLLPQMPVISVSEVVEDDELLVVDDDYILAGNGILYRVGQRWAKGPQIIEVTYSHGYCLPTDLPAIIGDVLPDDIISVCTRAASRSYQAGLKAEELAGIPGIRSTSLGDYAVGFGDESGYSGESALGASGAPILLRSEKHILDMYRV